MVMSNFEFVKNRCSENHGSRNGVNKFFACMSYIFTPFAQNLDTRNVRRKFTVLACFGNRPSISDTLLRAYMNLHHFHIYTRYGVKNLSMMVLTIFELVKSLQRRLYYAYVRK